MLKRASALLLILNLLLAASSIDTKIQVTNKKLDNYDERYKNVHKRLSESAKEILQTQKTLFELDRKLAGLTQALDSTQNQYDTIKDQIAKLQNTKSELTEKKESMRTELSRLMAKQLSLKVIIDQKAYNDTNALIRSEVFNAISRLTKQELDSLKKEIGTVLDDEESLSQKISTLSSSISDIDQKRREVLNVKTRHQKILADLNDQRERYKKDLEKTLSTKADLSKTLRQLKIIKEDQIKAEKRSAEEKERLAQLKSSKDAKSITDTKVKHGDLDEKVEVTKYRGRKTIAPLSDYKVIKKFGRYTDPIYNIKIFNESVSLEPTKHNASVRAVFNGKIILAKSTPLLGYFVIIEHEEGLHTIYAHLNKIAPTLIQGKRIRKGSIIGRVDDELMFEVTQRNFHINPLEIIR